MLIFRMPSMRLAAYLPDGRTSLRLAITQSTLRAILFPMQSLIAISRKLLGLFSALVLYLEFPFDYSISNDSSRHIGFFSMVRRLKAIFHENRKYIFLLQFLMKSDPYHADRFYLVIITVYVKTPESNMRYIL